MSELAITNLISKKREWNNCFIKNVPKYRKLVETKTKDAPKLMRLVTIFAEHGIMAHIPSQGAHNLSE